MSDSRFWRAAAVALIAAVIYMGMGLREGARQDAGFPPMDLLSTSAHAESPLMDEFEELNHTFLRFWSVDDKGVLDYRLVRLRGITEGDRELRSKIIPELMLHVKYDAGGRSTTLVNKVK